jgi:hypothetical protein
VKVEQVERPDVRNETEEVCSSVNEEQCDTTEEEVYDEREEAQCMWTTDDVEDCNNVEQFDRQLEVAVLRED